MKANQDCLTIRASVAAVCGALLALAMAPVAQSADTETDKSPQETVTPVTPGTATPTAPVTDAGTNKPAQAGNTEEASDNAELIEQTSPTNYVEAGAGYVSKDSYKFGEYNGLEKKGYYGVGNVDVRGGGTYDSDNARRWRITGTNLGLETRNVTAEYGEQGRFRVNFGYDELTRNRPDTYQTPYLGAGSNNLYLPGNWLVPVLPQVSATAPNARVLSPTVAQSNSLVTGVSTPPSAGQLATSNGIIAADVPDFHNYHLDTKRTKTDLGFGLTFSPQWEFKTSFSHEDKNGAKPMGTVTRASGGDISTIIPDPIDQSTDQFSASLNYTAEKGFMQAAYYGSLFHNHIESVTWQNWALPTPTYATMSSAPSNEFHQINLTGGYNFSQATKLVVNGSYARSTQNQSFLTDASTPVVPVSSLEGLVVNEAFNVKFTTRPTKDLNLSAGYKFDDRNNRTPVNIYQYADASETAAPGSANFPAGPNNPYGALAAQNANANRPYSKKLNQIDLGADWRVANGQWIKGDYQFQKIDRSCNGTWIDCVDAADSKENTLGAEYRNSVLDNVNGRIGYSRAKRTVDNYNEDAFLALVPYANVIPTGQTISAYQALLLSGYTGYGPVSGYNGGVYPGTGLTAGQAAFFFLNNSALGNGTYANNNRISELIGMRRYNMADRDRDKLRSSIDWQATEQLSIQAGFDYNKDDYSESVYGLQNAKSWALNLDGTYAASQEFSVTVFYTYEDQRSQSAGNTYVGNTNATTVGGVSGLSGNSGCDSYTTLQQRNNNNKIDPCANWSSDMRDKIDTLGLEFQKRNFFSPKIDIVGDLVFTRARSDNDVSGGNWQNNPHAGVAGDTIAAYYIPATALPTVTTDTIELRLNGSYKIDRASTMRVGYTYAHMKSKDWGYDGLQYGGLTGVLPTNEQAPNYSVNVIVVGYQYMWR